MKKNQNHTNAKAATDEPAAPRPLPPEVAEALEESFADAKGTCRHDGWTPERQRHFLEVLAACGTVANACRAVGMSVASAYAFRDRRNGRAFAFGWRTALAHRARHRIEDELMSRAINGYVDKVTDKSGEVVAERHRHDNRLAMAMLTRMDNLAERYGKEADTARAVAEDFEDFLDCIGSGGDAEAFIEERRPKERPERAISDSELIRRYRDIHRTYTPGDPRIPTHDLDTDEIDDWTDDQFKRAMATGILDRYFEEQDRVRAARGTGAP